MSSGLLLAVVVVLFAGTLVGARTLLARGANADVANGSVLLVLAIVFGVLLLNASTTAL